MLPLPYGRIYVRVGLGNGRQLSVVWCFELCVVYLLCSLNAQCSHIISHTTYVVVQLEHSKQYIQGFLEIPAVYIIISLRSRTQIYFLTAPSIRLLDLTQKSSISILSSASRLFLIAAFYLVSHRRFAFAYVWYFQASYILPGKSRRLKQAAIRWKLKLT